LINDIVIVRDWSYSVSCNNKSHGNIKYLSQYPTTYIGCDRFEIVGYDDYPSRDNRCLNDTMIESTKTNEIFFINRKFLKTIYKPPFIEENDFKI